jgi:NAD(P)-dependent dehydrogenase (short-subunit alcohol dehydrogenase family)
LPETLRGREVILAGGSGGLGSATARLLAAEGAHVVIGYSRNRRRAEVLGLQVVEADLTQPAERTRLLDAASGLYGLAVFTGDPSRVPDQAAFEETLQSSLDINFRGPLMLAREAAERMRARKTAGAIILFSTMQASALFSGSTAYAAPKSALVHAARLLAKEMRPDNIRVNVIAPGIMSAGMAEASIASGKYERFIKEGIINRYGRAEDVARAVRFLLEPDCYITGQVLSVDGGITL